MSLSSRVDSWNTSPIDCLTWLGCLIISYPPINAVPEVGLVRVASMLMVVDFPAPLGPRKPNISPPPTSKVTSSTAVRFL